MMRPGKNFCIILNDIKNGFVKKRTYKELEEYWIYIPKDSDLIGVDGIALKSENLYLKCIIVCSVNHITEAYDDKIEIEGLKFINDKYGMDLDDYLKKTNRGKNG